MIDTNWNSLKLAVVMLLALTCAGQQNPQSVNADRAADAAGIATPDVVTHTFDSPTIVDAAPVAAKNVDSKPKVDETPKVAAAPAPVAIQPAVQVAEHPVVSQPVASRPVANRVEIASQTENPAMVDAAPAAAFQQRHPRYLLRPGDVFDLTFDYSPELNQTVTVQPDGFISLREAGDVYVQGLTTAQLNQAVRSGYVGILHEPSIAVVPRNFEQPYFVVGGEVKTPGKFDLRGTTTVSEAVALAGGFTESAKHSHVLLFRREDPDKAIVVRSLNVKRMLNREDMTEDAQLRPGDMIYVPQNTLSKLKGYVIPRATVGPNIRPTP
jgi:polysaccharide export outer membrane protein